MEKYKWGLLKNDKGEGDVKMVIHEALKTYKLHEKKGEIGRILPKSDDAVLMLIIISYSIIISYYCTLGYTAIASLIGRNILYLFYTEEKSRLMNLKMSKTKETKVSSISMEEYFKYKGVDDRMLIRIGDYFISLLSQFPHNLFYRDFENSTKVNNS